MRLLLLSALALPLALLACTGAGSSSSAANNTCPSSDDAGAYEGSLFLLDDAGDLTINYDAGNGGIDLGSGHTASDEISHTYEWPCILTYDCQATARDASITFISVNGVNGWSVESMAFDNGSMCAAQTAVADAGGNCCVVCAASQMQQPCGGTCISSYDSCSVGPGCACQ